jgi:thioesterase domain-containing protein/acyl carrier protein
VNDPAQGRPQSLSGKTAAGTAVESAKIVRRDEIDPGTDYLAPSNPLQTHLAEIWQDILRVDRIGTIDSFFELGGDSLQAIELFLRVEREFGVVLPTSTIIDHPTVAKLAILLAGNVRVYAKRVLVLLQSEGAEPPLFLVHELSGNLFSYRALVQHLGAKRKIYGLINPGQDQNPPPALSIPELASMYVDAIKSVQHKGPYFLVGYSFGGLVVYEMARQLHEQGDQIGLLVIIDMSKNGGKMRGLLQRSVRKLSWHLVLMSEDKPSRWLAYITGALRKQFYQMKLKLRTQEQSDTKQIVRSQIYKTNRDAALAYAPPPYDGTIKLLRCLYQLNKPHYMLRDLGWAHCAKAGVEVYDLPADHFTVMSEPTVALVAAHIRQWLDQADKAPSAG